jgi:hypothetical protein
MTRDDWSDLRSVRTHLAAAVARLAELAEGVDDAAINTARDRLGDADTAVSRAAGGLSSWPRVGLNLMMIGVGSWAAATTGQLVGLSGGWTIALTSAAAVGLIVPLGAVTMAVDGRINRRRTAPAPPAAVPVEVSAAAEILARVRMARDDLRAAILDRTAQHRLGYLTGTPDGFQWLCLRGPRPRWMTLADRRLCLVSYAVEHWLRSGADQR